ncbi:ThiF family adenylyltransferase [Bacillus sp. 1NLA3E]|uniref:ThiF family adenylyltransferase n=1 Tax=Bacillus sp. 1NLA3E TaxID=666686 RepID=UPI000247E895|nr:ThiF family adenylyltransferase [Bacillus sp. 1NLA3E]AGK53319.1 thiamine/molybdopterin biosynthesis ThiF/MoeB-like protein [Bacillus sp. 1NLA3E]
MKDRYKKQELFLGSAGQARLQNAHVIIMGAGALGSTSAEMLARAGIGQITIVDRDYVEASNLQRQQLYTEDDAINKMPKAIAAKNRLKQINSEITINGLVGDINAQNIEELMKNKSIIVDATDNFETRMIMNDCAVKLGIPFIFGACVGSYGLTYPIIPGKTPCLHCLISHLPAQGMTCDTLGVISPIVQLVASYQVTRVLQYLTGHELRPVLQSFDIWKDESAQINVGKLKNQHCPTCGKDAIFPYLSFENQTKTDVLCGRDAIQLRPGTVQIHSLEGLAQNLTGIVNNLIVNPYLLSCTFEDHRIVLFKDGRAIIHGTNEPSRARSIYNKMFG